MRSVPGLLSVFLIAAGVACAELPPDLPPASPLPFAPGPVIGGTIKGNPATGIVPVKDLQSGASACRPCHSGKNYSPEIKRM